MTKKKLRVEINITKKVSDALEKKAELTNHTRKSYIEYLCINDVNDTLAEPKDVYFKLLGERMLIASRGDMIFHLLSKKAHEWKSGFLTDRDITEIEKETNKKVKCSTESGEYFYKLET